jgi:phospholipid N-methyltransferase
MDLFTVSRPADPAVTALRACVALLPERDQSFARSLLDAAARGRLSEKQAAWVGKLTAQGVPAERQDAMVAEIVAKAQPGAEVGPFTIPDDLADDVGAIKAALKAGVKVAVVGQLFPTPPALAERMVREAGIEPGHRVLEPSAGTGNLWRAIGRERDVQAVEIDARLCEALSREFTTGDVCLNVLQGDFLDIDPSQLGTFDRIVMNPPFADGADIKHIEHARRFLRPGGRLVAICAHGPRQQAAYAGKVECWKPLPEDTFKEQGTRVRTVMLIIEGPAEQRAAPVKEKVGQISLFG